ncbi:hypothetical protein NPA31_004265 [Aurantimonas sp. MSK8Z-1]|uniref:hypothetical protein n=1 Tax=Mangrovibrevibacter kandeliae TaxID=2968473 RepID=UPI002119A3F6|nr:hypothetical protein [Aurantimonas sp. MSK8Z-1]MCW4114178.1 hypothetical protein [Aurantimonas sp. MSK8Z-1]
MRHRSLLALLSLALASATSSAASAADMLQAAPPPEVVIAAKVPACDNPKVLAEVEDQFEYGARGMLQSDLQVLEFRNLLEKAYFPEDEEHAVERRYCQGEAVVAQAGTQPGYGETHTIYYVIEHPLGFASIGWKAQGCFLGLDRWHVYGANCSSLRRF